MCVCVCQKSGAHAFGSVRDTRDTHGGENVDTPIGQFLLIGNFRRRLARELLVLRVCYCCVCTTLFCLVARCVCLSFVSVCCA